MRREFKALAGVAVAAFPLQELAFLLPHRAEFAFCVVVACGLLALWSWVCRPQVATASEVVEGKALVLMLREVAQAQAAVQGKVTADDLRAVAEKAGISINSGALAHVFRSPLFTKIGEVKSRNKDNHGRPIGVYALCGEL